jgi:outer membrane protein assembly factor BamD (BamD/ComL family)
VDDVREQRERSFEEVQSDVFGRIRRARSTQAIPDLIAGLEAKYHVQYLELPGPSAEELFAMAQGAPNPQAKVAHFEEFVELHPDDPRVLDALFMIGFTRKEELHDEEGAQEAFRRVIRDFPDSELAQSARWMLSSEGSEVPAFGNDGTEARE